MQLFNFCCTCIKFYPKYLYITLNLIPQVILHYQLALLFSVVSELFCFVFMNGILLYWNLALTCNIIGIFFLYIMLLKRSSAQQLSVFHLMPCFFKQLVVVLEVANRMEKKGSDHLQTLNCMPVIVFIYLHALQLHH